MCRAHAIVTCSPSSQSTVTNSATSFTVAIAASTVVAATISATAFSGSILSSSRFARALPWVRCRLLWRLR